jgi:excisionase family DNA binding protein
MRPLPEPLVYTAQDVARFCEVDLKTIHHWADGGKIAHHRTEGRHLRFRRNHVIAFLRGHGYPIHEQIGLSRPNVFFALGSIDGAPPLDDVARKLSSRFFVRRFETALTAVAHLVATAPDALVVSDDDPTWNVIRGLRALKNHAETEWPIFVVVSAKGDEHAALKEAGADLVMGPMDVARLHLELARILSVD